MEKMIFDQSPSALDHVPISRSNKSMNSYSSFSSSSSSSYSPYSSGNSLSYLLYNYNVSAMPKLNNNAWPLCQNPLVPLSPSLYSSLPLPQPKQPPLLPLPLHKTSSFPTQLNQKKFNGPSAPKRKPRATKREPRTESKNVEIPLERKISLPPVDHDMIANDENNTDEEILITSQVKEGNILDCYSISPPPSSLPLPGLALLRPKMKRTTACITEAVLEEAKFNNPVVDNGSATDNLRRILRL